MKCSIVVCLSVVLPLVMTYDLSQTAKLTLKEGSKRFGPHKRGFDIYRWDEYKIAFNRTDLNGDGSITADEWATHYTTTSFSGYTFRETYDEWVTKFNRKLAEPGFDSNGNGSMEFLEYLELF